jgi:DNA excision repair protein ERCC-2
MSIHIDEASRTISLGVRDLCGAEATGGSLNLSPLSAVRNEMGREVHAAYQTTQSTEHESYLKEHTLRHTMQFGNYSVVIHGRSDGIYEADGTTVIEEVKSVLRLAEDVNSESAPLTYVLQLRIYLYLWGQLHPGSKVVGRLVLIRYEPEQIRPLEILPDTEAIESLIHERLKQIIGEHEQACRRRALKQVRADSIVFPFPQMRKHQDRMVETVSSALEQQSNLLVSAPTGIGKTVAALYASLRFAVKHGLAVIFLTSKTTQQKIVADTLRLWNVDPGTQPQASSAMPVFNGLILRSKEKSCANDVVFCHESRCRYAQGFFRKLSQSNSPETLLGDGLITPERVYAAAVDEELCPFELSLEVLRRVDVTVCDYNYVYDPAAFDRMDSIDRGRTILIVDEAHNLYARAREYFSPELALRQIEELRESLRPLSGPNEEAESQSVFTWEAASEPESRPPSQTFLARLDEFLERIQGLFSDLLETYPEAYESGHAVVSLDRECFVELRGELDELMKRYLIYQRRSGHVQEEDRLLQCFYALSDFCQIVAMEGEEFVHTLSTAGGSTRLKIVCVDPACQLRKVNERYRSVIAMSATLSPMEFYRDVLGFERDTELLALPSPFPRENRRILIVPEVSTAYQQRAKHFPRIARIIEEVVSIRPGNYFAFFPSFEFLKEVARLVRLKDSELLIQDRIMPDHHRSALLEKLREPGKRHLVLAVQGGVFAEGVDYPGELAVGAIIVGPGLPKVSFEQELMRQFYEDAYSKGFEYAYLYPGMNRVVQSAGRIVRSETDRGIIVLLDKRFAYENYSRLLPRDWYESSPAELTAQEFRNALSEFWAQ